MTASFDLYRRDEKRELKADQLAAFRALADRLCKVEAAAV